MKLHPVRLFKITNFECKNQILNIHTHLQKPLIHVEDCCDISLAKKPVLEHKIANTSPGMTGMGPSPSPAFSTPCVTRRKRIVSTATLAQVCMTLNRIVYTNESCFRRMQSSREDQLQPYKRRLWRNLVLLS